MPTRDSEVVLFQLFARFGLVLGHSQWSAKERVRAVSSVAIDGVRVWRDGGSIFFRLCFSVRGCLRPLVGFFLWCQNDGN